MPTKTRTAKKSQIKPIEKEEAQTSAKKTNTRGRKAASTQPNKANESMSATKPSKQTVNIKKVNGKKMEDEEAKVVKEKIVKAPQNMGKKRTISQVTESKN